MKILSIDDNKNSLLIIEDFTEPLSLNIDSFEDPQKALLSSESIEYDLVIVDYIIIVITLKKINYIIKLKNI